MPTRVLFHPQTPAPFAPPVQVSVGVEWHDQAGPARPVVGAGGPVQISAVGCGLWAPLCRQLTPRPLANVAPLGTFTLSGTDWH